MPTYDYQCRACGAVIEVIHPMTDAGPSTCETCGGELRRVLYPAGIIFKGSGFYRTDSRTNGSGTAKSASGSSSGATSSDTKGSGSGESSAGGGSSTASTSDAKTSSSGSGD